MRKQLTTSEVRAIYSAEGTLKALGRMYGVSDSHIGRIKRGEVHRSITHAVLRTTPRGLTADQVRELVEYPASIRAAARDLGLAAGTVRKYRKHAKQIVAFV